MMKLCYLSAATLLVAIALPDAEALSLVTKIKAKLKKGDGLIGMPPLPQPDIAHGGKDMENIFQQNEAWIAKKKAEDPAFFDKLGAGHSPNYFWIGCADARVPANEIMGEPAGSVFVSRSVANMVVSTDFNLMSALQYAVAYLKIPHIIVCGHYECGGVKASVTRFNHMPPLENWLRNIRDVYRIHRKELDAIKDPQARHKRLVELNVREQCINVYKTGVVQQRRFETAKSGQEYATPCVHGVVFDPKVGILKRVDVDFEAMTDDIEGIFDLYGDYKSSVSGMSPPLSKTIPTPAGDIPEGKEWFAAQ